jgi:hypothetical protein
MPGLLEALQLRSHLAPELVRCAQQRRPEEHDRQDRGGQDEHGGPAASSRKRAAAVSGPEWSSGGGGHWLVPAVAGRVPQDAVLQVAIA